MVKKLPLLEQMRANVRADWTIADVQRVCNELGVALLPPNGGSHYKAASPYLDAHLMIPAKRPIKPIYIRQLIVMLDVHAEVSKKKGK